MASAKVQIELMSTAIDMYYREFGRYPSTEEGLAILVQELTLDGSSDDQTIRFIKKLPLDPWGNNYQYRSPGLVNTSSYDLWSFGADGIEGGEGLNLDCGNWVSQACNNLRMSRHTDYTPVIYMVLSGLLFGLPLYLYKSIANWRLTGDLEGSVRGFHLGVLVYLMTVPSFVVLLLIIFI
jgi:general secretion pathway protein G